MVYTTLLPFTIFSLLHISNYKRCRLTLLRANRRGYAHLGLIWKCMHLTTFHHITDAEYSRHALFLSVLGWIIRSRILSEFARLSLHEENTRDRQENNGRRLNAMKVYRDRECRWNFIFHTYRTPDGKYKSLKTRMKTTRFRSNLMILN